MKKEKEQKVERHKKKPWKKLYEIANERGQGGNDFIPRPAKQFLSVFSCGSIN